MWKFPSSLKLDEDSKIEFCKEYKYLGVFLILAEQTTKKYNQECYKQENL